MTREKLYEPYEIIYKKIDECIKGEHRHMFFELVYVISGTGRQCINHNEFNYRAGHMFLLTPEDCHAFEVETTTEFFFLRFTDIYLKSANFRSDDIRRLEYILHNASHQPGCILKNFSDKPLVKSIIEAVIGEYINRDLYNKELIGKLIDTLIVIVARNIAKYLPKDVQEHTEEKVIGLLNYVQANIFYPNKLKAEGLSKKFGISENYVSRYLKSHTDQTLQQYISYLRMRHVETRLKFSDMRINEIAHELGFSDESHFNKFCKKMLGKSPLKYRKDFAPTTSAS